MQGLRSVIHQRRLLNPFRFGFYSLQLFTHKVLRRLVTIHRSLVWTGLGIFGSGLW